MKQAPLPEGSSGWDETLNISLDEIVKRAQKNEAGYKTILKLLRDKRFDK